MEKTKILQVAPGFLYGGIESRMVDWYSCMDRDRIQFDVLKVTPEKPNPLVDQIRNMGGNVYSIPPLGARTAGAHIKAVKEIVSCGGYDVVHAHSLSYGYFPLRYAKANGVGVRVLHSRTTGSNPGDKHKAADWVLSNAALPLATHRFACSVNAGEYAFGNSRPFSVIDNGIFTERYAFDEEKRLRMRDMLGVSNCYVIVAVARLSTQKNIPYLVDVFGKVSLRCPEARLLLVGDDSPGPVKDEVDAKIAEYGLADKVIFAGRQDRPQDWLQAADLFVLPSLFEGFGTVAIEAQANGLPCVLSEGFPTEACLLDSAVRLPLTDMDRWVDVVLGFRGAGRVLEAHGLVAAAGYDVRITARRLEAFYHTGVLPDAGIG